MSAPDAIPALAFAASRSAMQQQGAAHSEALSREAGFAAHYANIPRKRLRTSSRTLHPRLLPSLGLPADNLHVYNTHLTRVWVAKRHGNDADFILRNLMHAVANPYLYRQSLQHSDRVEIIGWAEDREHLLHVVLEAPAAKAPSAGWHGWLQVRAMRIGQRQIDRARYEQKWDRMGRGYNVTIETPYRRMTLGYVAVWVAFMAKCRWLPADDIVLILAVRHPLEAGYAGE